MKKALSLILALVMVLSLAACGGSGNNGGSGNGGSGSQGGNNGGSSSQGGGSDSTPTTKISIMLPSMFGGEMSEDRPNVDKVTEKLKEITGVDVEWHFAANDGYGDSFNMQLLDRNNMPMIMTAGGGISSNTAVLDAANNGAFWDLTPFIESGDYPYLEQVDPAISAQLTVNGALVGIPKLRDPGRYGFSYRADWAEKLGFTEQPQTPDEVYDMLYAFAHNDPDGNGKDDTYGMEACGEYTGWMDIIQTWFGCGYGWVEQNGDLVPVHETPEYKEALDWMRKLCENGVIRKDFVTVQASEWSQAVQSGQAGSIVDTLDSGGRRAWKTFVDGNVPSVVNPDETASMVIQGPVNGHTALIATYNGYFLITKAGAKTEEDVKACLHFLDQMNSVEGRTLADWGIEGLTYEIQDDGTAKIMDGLEAAAYPFQGLNQAVGYIPYRLEGTLQAKQQPWEIACTEAMKRSAEVCVLNPAEAYLSQSPTNATMGTILAQTISDARTNYISGNLDWDGFQAKVAEWEAQGGAAVKTEVNEAYHAANK